MSDNIPFEIEVEIMKSLPVKSLLKFRSVSKTWKSLIDGSDFIVHYKGPHRLLVGFYETVFRTQQNYVSIVDDVTSPEQKVTVTLPRDSLQRYRIVGCSHGLLCLFRKEGHNSPTGKAVIWNMSIRKMVDVVVPNVEPICVVSLGFGVCPQTMDPKIVKMTQIRRYNGVQLLIHPWKVEVFTLSTGAWKSLYTTDLPCKSINFRFLESQVVADGFIYWLANDANRITTDGSTDGRVRNYSLIISFDITTEEFREVILPYSLARSRDYALSISKLRGSLVVIECCEEANNRFFGVWIMEDGDPKSFTKLFNVNLNNRDASVTGFTKNGEPIVYISENDHVVLVVYAPYSEHDNILEIGQEIEHEFFVYPYMETLLLLDKPALI